MTGNSYIRSFCTFSICTIVVLLLCGCERYRADLAKRRQAERQKQARAAKLQIEQHGVNMAMFNKIQHFHTKEQVDEITGLTGQLIETVTDFKEPMYAYAWHKDAVPVGSNYNDRNGIDYICVSFTDDRSLSKKYQKRSESFFKHASPEKKKEVSDWIEKVEKLTPEQQEKLIQDMFK